MIKILFKSCLLLSSVFIFSNAQAQSQSERCMALNASLLEDGVITSVDFVASGTFDASSLRDAEAFQHLNDFCRVSATLSPVTGSAIKIEVWLPANNWNNRLVAVGNGGFAGVISYAALAESLSQGYAAVSTDTGHVGGTPDFLSNETTLTDFAHRAIHEMTVAAKHLVDVYYRTEAQFTYFNGCSTGGRQALTAAQRYPQDFDGIIAGAPANSTVRMTMQQLWNSRIVNDTHGLELNAEDFERLHQDVLSACDALDGLSDGIIENPAVCAIELADIAGFSQQEVEAFQKIYQGAQNPRTGEIIYPGFAKGSESGWTAMVRSEPFAYSNAMQGYVVNQDPEWDFLELDFARDLSAIDQRINQLGMQAIDPDLSEFIAHGGKLLLYHGWNDPLISPFNSINYYNQVHAALGERASESVQLFMMPAVNHCQGGNGFDTWEKLQVMDDWRTTGAAPDRIEATRQGEDGSTTSRPLCAYPQTAVYTGNGSPDQAANFQCR
jgi:feruloyl esterase